MSNPVQRQPPIYVDPITGAPLSVDPVTGQLTYGTPATTPIPSPSPLPPTVPLPAGHLPSAFPTTPAATSGAPVDPWQPGPAAPTYATPAYPQQPGYPPQPGYPVAPGYPVPTGYPGQPGYPYGATGYSYPLSGAPAVGRNGLALASMIVALCGICVGGPIAGLVGAILGHVARRQVRRSGQDGAGMALTGIIVGWALVAIYGSIIVLAIVSDASTN
jgi:hypothetical protein